MFKGTDYLRWDDFLRWMISNFGMSTNLIAPTIYVGPYDYIKMEELSKGNTIIKDVNHIREGIVIRPMKEKFNEKIGRVILKFLNDDYLLDQNPKTEYH